MRQWENSRSCTWKIAKSQARGSSVERVAPLCNCRGCRVNVHLSQLAGPSVPSYGSSLCNRVCVHYVWPAASPFRHHVCDSPLVAQPSSQGYCAITYAIVRLASFQPLHEWRANLQKSGRNRKRKKNVRGGEKRMRAFLTSVQFFFFFQEYLVSLFLFFW